MQTSDLMIDAPARVGRSRQPHYAIDRALEPLRWVFRWGSLVMLVAMVSLPFMQVVMREIFSAPIVGAEELARFMLICTVFIALPYVVSSGANIRMEEFLALFPRDVVRAGKMAIAAVTATATFAVAASREPGRDRQQSRQCDADARHPVLRSFSAPPSSASPYARSNARSSSSRRPGRPLYVTFAAGEGARGRAQPARRDAALRGGTDMALTVILAFMALFLFGFPVVLAIVVPAISTSCSPTFPLELVAQRMTYALDIFPLVAVPVFIFVGSLMNQSGITSDIYRFAHTLGGRVPGGLAQVNVIGSLVFSGMSGAALADIGGLGRIEIRAMVRAGFTPRLLRPRSPAPPPWSGRSSRHRSRSSSTARSPASRSSSC